MSRRRSPILGKRYPLRTVCEVWRVPRSSVYALTAPAAAEVPTATRGPKRAQSDADVVAVIRAILATSPFHSEGHRKVRVRLRQQGVRVGKARVVRLMRVHGLLAPTRPGHVHGDPAHTGRITTARPAVLWGTDATCCWTAQDGWGWFFGAIDQASDALVGWKATKRGDRWAALEPLYQGVRYAFGRAGKDVARGLSVRSDWGPQYTAHAFGAKLRWLGIQHSPSLVGEPPCNGVLERFMRTLKEQCLWLHRFVDLAHAERAIGAFIERYNQEWLVERHGHCSPRAIRATLRAAA